MYEVSSGDECPHRAPRNQSETRANLDNPDCAPASQEAGMPWTYISENQAMQACAKAGKRLPTNKEWYRASLGTPDGGTACNIGGASRGVDTSGAREECVSSAGAYDMVGNVWEWVDGSVTDGVFAGRMLPAAGYVRGADGDGIPTATAPDADPNYGNDFLWMEASSTMGMMRGGFWGRGEEMGVYAIYAASEPSFAGEAVGFRCVKTME
jgi:formylglycine-generating enzyme required for sulfatase activity